VLRGAWYERVRRDLLEAVDGQRKEGEVSARIRTHLGANVVACIAIFVALSSGAYAVVIAPRDSVVSRSIKNGQVKKQDIGSGAVASSQFSSSATAPSAIGANDAEKLAGTAAAGYQQRVTQSCANDQGIDSLGSFGCSPAVTPASVIEPSGTASMWSFAGDKL